MFEDESVELQPLSCSETLEAEFGTMELSTNKHPITLYRQHLTKLSVLKSHELINGEDRQLVKVAVMSVVLQRPPTAKRHAFLTLEDEFSLMNVIIRPDVLQAHKRLNASLLLIVEGKIQKRGDVVNVIANKFWELPETADTEPSREKMFMVSSIKL